MNWYEIEYTGSKSTQRMLGTYDGDLFSLLALEDVPRFIEIKNMAYFSDLSKKYELYDAWDSKWTNEALLSVDCIISVRKIHGNILGHEIIGETNTRAKSVGFSVIVSKASADKERGQIKEVFIPELETLLKKKGGGLTYQGNYKYTEESLLEEGEFVVRSYGNEIFRDKVEGDFIEGILSKLDKLLNKYIAATEEED